MELTFHFTTVSNMGGVGTYTHIKCRSHSVGFILVTVSHALFCVYLEGRPHTLPPET